MFELSLKLAERFTYEISNTTCDNRCRGSSYAFTIYLIEISTIHYPDLQNEKTVLIRYICLNRVFFIFRGVSSNTTEEECELLSLSFKSNSFDLELKYSQTCDG